MVLDILQLPYEWREIDIMKRETHSAEFLAMNPKGQVPVLKIDAQAFLPESNAILWYLAEGTPLVPRDKLQRAQALRWMFFEQYNHEPSIAVARFIHRFLKQSDHPRLPDLMKRGDEALAVMENHLQQRTFFVGSALSVADLALFAYTHKAADGGYDLAKYPAIAAWVQRCLQQPGVTVMPSP
jgi:glutathione S-transferase